MTQPTIQVDRLYEQIGKAICDLRQAKKPKLTQAALAEMLGITRTSITNIEKGTQRVPLHLLYELCSKLSVQLSDVIPRLDDVIETSVQPNPRSSEESAEIPPKTAALIRNLAMDGRG